MCVCVCVCVSVCVSHLKTEVPHHPILVVVLMREDLYTHAEALHAQLELHIHIR